MRLYSVFALLALSGSIISPAYAAEVTGSIDTNSINQGIQMNLPCNPSTVPNGTVNSYTCAITCNSGFLISGNSCYSPSSAGSGGG